VKAASIGLSKSMSWTADNIKAGDIQIQRFFSDYDMRISEMSAERYV
jgi:hypothetical protein